MKSSKDKLFIKKKFKGQIKRCAAYSLSHPLGKKIKKRRRLSRHSTRMVTETGTTSKKMNILSTKEFEEGCTCYFYKYGGNRMLKMKLQLSFPFSIVIKSCFLIKFVQETIRFERILVIIEKNIQNKNKEDNPNS